MKDSYSHVESSAGKFFHLMRYSIIDQVLSFLVLVSSVFSSSNMNFPSSSRLKKMVLIGVSSPITFFKQETLKIQCT